MKIVAIEGCMGAGKSTVLDGLKSRLQGMRQQQQQHQPPLHVAKEPVEGWAHLLGAFYADPSGHSLALQLAVLFSRIRQLVDILKEGGGGEEEKGRVLVTERSVDSGSDVFIPMLRSAALMTADEEREYKRRRQTMYAAAALLLTASAALKSAADQEKGEEEDALFDDDIATPTRMTQKARWQKELAQLHGVVYLEASPETCLRRVRARSRDGETNLSLDYLQDLQAAYVAWLAQLRARGVPVIAVDAEVDGDEEAIADAVARGVRDCVHVCVCPAPPPSGP